MIAFSIIIIGLASITFAGLVYSRKRNKGLSNTIEQLKREIEERKQIEAEYREARTEAESANLSKSQFLANMSHEIRTPMNAIIGMSELVLGTELTIEQEEYITTLKTSAESLLGLLNDILDLSKIEMGKLDIEPVEFDFRECLNEIAKNLFIHVQRKKIELIYDIGLDIPKILWGDPSRLRQILTNLIGNAVKFTDEGTILLKINIEKRKPGTRDTVDELVLHFSISDTGIGIPEDKQELIFEKFTQSDSSITRRFGGSGLGLAISMQLVQLMGGNLRVQSPGQLKGMKNGAPGSTFHITLSFGVPGQEVRELGEPIDIKMLKGVPALVVDDNPINRKIFKEMLERWGLKPQMADSGTKALELLKQAAAENKKFQLVLMDIQMPKMDGIEATGLIRKKEKEENAKMTPIIALTAHAMKGDKERFLKAGMNSYISKPIKQNQLMETIEKLFYENQGE